MSAVNQGGFRISQSLLSFTLRPKSEAYFENLNSMTRLHSGNVSPPKETGPSPAPTSLHRFGKIHASPEPSNKAFLSFPLTDGVELLVPKREGEKCRTEKSSRDPTMIRIARFGVRVNPLDVSMCSNSSELSFSFPVLPREHGKEISYTPEEPPGRDEFITPPPPGDPGAVVRDFFGVLRFCAIESPLRCPRVS